VADSTALSTMDSALPQRTVCGTHDSSMLGIR
jgi:hypothetical protein